MKKSRVGKGIQVILSILIVIFFIADCFMIHLFVKTVPINKTDFASFEEFQKAGAAGYMNMPENATAQRYYLSYEGFNIKSMYSYKVEDEEEFGRQMEHIKNYSCNESAVQNPAWDWYDTYEGSDEEKKQMEYLLANYQNMNYKDILTYARIGKGFANAYGAFVSEFVDLEYSLGEFPKYLPFEKLVEDDISTYTILYYQPMNTGTISQGILVNEETKTFVIYYYSIIK